MVSDRSTNHVMRQTGAHSASSPAIPCDVYDATKPAVSTVSWDGYSYDETLTSMARLGIRRIEWAFIDGYMDPFSDSDLNASLAAYLKRKMAGLGQICAVLSTHIDGGTPDAATRLETRLWFAYELGARWLITNAADRCDREAFYRNLESVYPLARDLGIRVCFENPGNAGDHLINSAGDLPNFRATLDQQVFGINYDAGNLVSHRPDIDPESDLAAALAYCDHLHLKAVRRTPHGYQFGALGEMGLDYSSALKGIAQRGLPFSLELPFRLHRNLNGTPRRAESPLDLNDIERRIAGALRWVADHYPQNLSSLHQGASHDSA